MCQEYVQNHMQMDLLQYKLLHMAGAMMVPQLIWSPHLFGPQEIWAPGNLGPGKFSPQEIWSPGNLVPKKFGPQESWSPGNFAKYERNQIRINLSEHLYCWLNNTSQIYIN